MDLLVIVILGGAVFLVLLVVLVTTASRRRREAEAPDLLPPEEPLLPPPEAPEAEAPLIEVPPPPEAKAPTKEVLETPLLPRTEAAPTAPPPPAPPAAPPRLPREKVITRLGKGLQKTRHFFSERLSMIARRGLDEDAWDEIEEALIRADVGIQSATEITSRLKSSGPSPGDLTSSLRNELVTILDRGDRRLRFANQGPTVWLVVGVNGTGKTTSIAKMAARLRQEGKSVVLAAADTFRAAAIEQLATWADRVGVHMVRHAPGADPGAVLYDALEHAKARGIDVVIADTAGRLHTKTNLMEELGKVRRVAERQAGEVHEVLLVLDATVGQNGIAQARTFQEAVQVTGIVLTKLDGTARGGIVVAVQDELGIPVKLVGVGEGTEDLEPFEPEAFAEALLG